jgi:hypothetical protein
MTSPRPLARIALASLLGVAFAAAGAAAVADSPGAAPAAPARGGYAPDPAGVPSAKQWVFDVAYAGKKASITRARAATLARPAATARVMGRFAIELYVGKELLDRLRFDIPLTGDAPERPAGHLFRRPRFDHGVTARLRVQMADNPRATYAKLVDRLTGAEQRFAWPPGPDGQLAPWSGAAAVASDAGPSGAADAGDAGALPDAGEAGDAARH